MKIKTFEEWVAAVEMEYVKFSTMHDYLNVGGVARLNTFRVLSEASCFASTASDMLELIEAYEGLSEAPNAAAPVRALKVIAAQENAAKEEKQAFRTAKTMPKGNGHSGRNPQRTEGA